jgi:hypothetical protein
MSLGFNIIKENVSNPPSLFQWSGKVELVATLTWWEGVMILNFSDSKLNDCSFYSLFKELVDLN